jgi:glycerol kinase
LTAELRRAAEAMEAASDGGGSGSNRPAGGAVRVGGGGANSELLCTILADVMGRQLLAIPEGEETVALGAARLVSGRFHIVCGRFDWDLPICCVFLS